MIFDDPKAKESALRRIELMVRLTGDLSDIVAGAKPTPADLAAAPLLRSYRFVPRWVPSLRGFSVGHPHLVDGPITTSQVYMIDPEQRWVRTLSRFYRLEDPDTRTGLGDTIRGIK